MRTAKITNSLKVLRGSGLELGTILDVGVQHGTPPLMKVFPDRLHLLFEPVEEYYEKIRLNYRDLNHRLVEAAVSDTDGQLTLHTAKKTRGDEISHSWIVERGTPTSREVSCLTLDRYLACNQVSAPYLLKIDVEGPSVPSRILRGAMQTLKATVAVVIEMTVDTFMDRATLLHEAEFDLWDLCDLCYYGGCLWQADAVFVKREWKERLPALAPMRIKPFRKELWQSGLVDNI